MTRRKTLIYIVILISFVAFCCSCKTTKYDNDTQAIADQDVFFLTEKLEYTKQEAINIASCLSGYHIQTYAKVSPFESLYEKGFFITTENNKRYKISVDEVGQVISIKDMNTSVYLLGGE